MRDKTLDLYKNKNLKERIGMGREGRYVYSKDVR